MAEDSYAIVLPILKGVENRIYHFVVIPTHGMNRICYFVFILGSYLVLIQQDEYIPIRARTGIASGLGAEEQDRRAWRCHLMCSLGYCLYDLLLLFHILVFNPLRPSLMANAMFSPSGRFFDVCYLGLFVALYLPTRCMTSQN